MTRSIGIEDVRLSNPLDFESALNIPRLEESDQKYNAATQQDKENDEDIAPVPFPVAIVGMAMRLPGGVNGEKDFWDFLINKKDGHCKVPESRYNIDAFYHKDSIPGSIRTQHGYFLQQDIAHFDAGFFGISKIEASKLDPQQRMLLEIIWECMENGGQTQWRGKNTGCYVGVFGEDWLDLSSRDPQANDRYRVVSAGDFALANRVSYQYDLRGPSMTLRTGCSSSLVGLHEACQALYAGECSAALVAGTNLILTPTMTTSMSENMVISPSGVCRTFDAAADVRAVIRSIAVNCDGKTPSITTPGLEAQERLVRRTYRKALIDDIARTGFFECHGTGTIVGDTAETSVVAKIFGKDGIHIGAVKPNVGHSEGASGITSVIKCVLALENRVIPPNAYFEQPNPNIAFEQAKLQVPVNATPWPSDRLERVSLNSFGIGGTNAHLIMDSAASVRGERETRAPAEQAYSLLLLSAKTPKSLDGNVEAIRHYLEASPGTRHDLAYTLAFRRTHLSYKAFAIAQKDGSLIAVERGRRIDPNPVFVFSGQGAQWPGMGRELLLQSDSFRESIRELDRILQDLKPAPDWSIEDELCHCDDASRMSDPRLAQPLCTAVQIALVNLLRDWGILPCAVVGHSSGEIAAAYAAGAISASTAIAVAYPRGRAMDALTKRGAMAAVGLGHNEVKPYLRDGVVVACENSPKSVTISGDEQVLDSVLQALEAEEIFCRRLAVKVAYHSHHMKEVGGSFEGSLPGVDHGNGSMTPMFSTVTGEVMTDPTHFTPAYWRQNLESPVLFSTAIQKILKESGPGLFVELGPHSVLSAPLRQMFSQLDEKKRPAYVPTLIRKEDQWKCILATAGHLHIHGVSVHLSTLIPPANILTDLPPYAWEHGERYWSETRLTHDWRLRQHPRHELLGRRTLESSDIEPTWRNLLQVENVLWLLDHKIGGEVVFPCAGYVAMAGEAIHQISGAADYSIRNLFMRTALVLGQTEPEGLEMVTSLRPARLADNLDSEWYEFTISAYQHGKWRKHCIGQIRSGPAMEHPALGVNGYSREISSEKWYAALQDRGLEYGPQFRGLQNITASPSDSKAAAMVQDVENYYVSRYALHPILIDQCLRLLSVAATQGISRRMTRLCIPTAIESLYVATGRGKMALDVSCDMGGSTMTGDALLIAQDEVVLSMRRGVFFGVSESALEDAEVPLASTLHWKPHVDLVDPEKLFPIERKSYPGDVADELIRLMIVESYHRTKSCLPEKEHLRHYKSWLDGAYARFSHDDGLYCREQEACAMKSAHRYHRIEEILGRQDNPFLLSYFKLAQRVLSHIEDILNDKLEPRELLEEDGGTHQLHESMAQMAQWDDFLSAMAHSKPSHRILKIGAGNGSITSVVLKGLSSASVYSRTRMYAKYTLTDTSTDNLSRLKERFKEHSALEYLPLDITKDPLTQDFEAGSYDLVIASNLLHTTPQIVESLGHIQKLLAPGGRLLLHKMTNTFPLLDYVMGILPSWWREHGSKAGLSREEWHQKLLEAGFTGADVFSYNNMEPYEITASILSSLPRGSIDKGTVTLLSRGPSSTWARAFQERLTAEGFVVQCSTLYDDTAVAEDVISLLDAEGPFFHDISSKDFEAFQTFVKKIEGHLLWVTQSAIAADREPNPEFSLALGMMRTLRQETAFRTTTVEVDDFHLQSIDIILEVFQKVRGNTEKSQEIADREFAIRNGVVHVGRFQWTSLDDVLNHTDNAQHRAIDVKCFGVMDSITWMLDGRPPPVEDDGVEVDIKFVGLNFRVSSSLWPRDSPLTNGQDIMVAMGLMGETGHIGLEASGIVRRVGAGVADIRPGDRVVTAGRGLMATRRILRAGSCLVIPDNLSLEDAAAGACVFTTVSYSLIHCANLQKGQTVLIHSACGGVGLGAIQICQMIGAEIFATVGSQEKKEHLMEHYGIPEDCIFDSRSTSFHADVMRMTNNRGVDLVLNSLAGELLHASWRCVAPFGKMIKLGKRDFLGHGKLDMDLFGGNRSFIGVDLLQIQMENPQFLSTLMRRYLQDIREGAIQPLKPVTVYDAANIAQAFRFMQSGKHIGKLVIRMPDEPSSLPASGLHERGSLFSSNTSYLLVGGFGGLGRAVATWMVEKGARNLVVLSRSGDESPTNRAFVRDLESQGSHVTTVTGSVANMQDVRRAVAAATQPIAGVIQMSMVLRVRTFVHVIQCYAESLQDQLFEKMTHEEWKTALAPKVEGTWNLHRAVEGLSLDFFILFSSLTGICGHSGSANYAAANTFLDSFVQYRQSQGLPASVLDIGFMGDIGYVSEHAPRTLEYSRSISWQILKERNLLQALELAVLGGPPQLAVGLGTTRAISELTSGAPWGQDARFDAWSNVLAESDNGGTGQGEELKKFLASVEQDPTLLDDQATEDRITYELGKMIASHMSYPEDMELEDLANIAIDSLMTIEIRSWFRRHVKVEISLVEISNAGTVRGLSKTTIKILRDKYASGELKQGESIVTNLAETAPDEMCLCRQDRDLGTDMHPIAGAVPDWYAPGEGRVFLTGASGYLGTFFLSLLAGLPHVLGIACLVRAPDAAAGLSRLQKALEEYGLPFDFASKLVIIPGDVADPTLGIGEDSFKEWAARCSVVFHLAAFANYTLPYSAHRDANVLGLVNMLRFANTGRLKPIHFTSSISACGVSKYLTGQLIPENERLGFDLDDIQQHIGYTQSKVVAEQIAWNAMANGLPVTIHRPGFVSGHSVTGTCKTTDVLNRLMASCIRIGHYPIAPPVRNQFIPVDFVCSALLRISLVSGTAGQAYNLVQPDQSRTITWNETFGQLSRLCSPALRRVSSDEFIRIFAEKEGQRMKAGVSMLEDKLRENMIFWGLDGGTMAVYETRNMREALAEFPEVFQVPDTAELLRRYFPLLPDENFILVVLVRGRCAMNAADDAVERAEADANPVSSRASLDSSFSSSSEASQPRLRTLYSRRTETDLERYQTSSQALDRIETQRLQHALTVGESVKSQSRASARAPLPAFGAGKPYPPQLPNREDYVIEFDGTDDPLYPQNWSTRRKLCTGAILAFTSICSTFDSAVFSSSTGNVARVFGVGVEVATLSSSLYILGYACGPLLWAPFSELQGRRLPILIGMLGFGIFNTAVAVAKDLQTLLICRFFCGVFGSCPLAVVAAIFSDIFDNRFRGIAIAMFSSMVFLGPLLAPFIGGFINMSYLSWRWTAYIPAFMGYAALVLNFFFLKESYPPVILIYKAAELRRRTKNWGIHAKQEEIEIDLQELLVNNFSRPLRLLIREPLILAVTVYLSFIYGLLYCFLTAYTLVYQGVYHMNAGVGGLPLFGMVAGLLIAGTYICLFASRSYNKKLQANAGIPVPEWRLPPVIVGGALFAAGIFWFGWTGFTADVPWIVSTLSGLFTGFGLLIVFIQLFNYLIDTYLMFAASAIAANTFCRSVLAASFPLFSRQMFNNMGIQWAATLLGCVATALVPIPVMFYFYGKRLRRKSRFAPTLELDETAHAPTEAEKEGEDARDTEERSQS
ncbi:uncharacterized protein CDV56_103490 [Aspergillus thermomutatus]|uniref:Carrier domain-containing protein n=1 Tax=Aspergillus thermomutatus TaxID=41047 RepID=A0A397GFP0_ASPTH|nr:uncharacterized protein CDV56_103490 [Aspergillus thermomutatus]RHZ46920.1 hypothetical protein CDV56_103490 [Aspergillus thermomutatus]